MASTDGKPVEDGTVADANLDSSSSEGGQQSSNAVTETAKQLKALQDRVDALTRSLQSEKDKAVARTNQRIDSLEKDVKTVLQSAMQKGQNIQDVLVQLEEQERQERDQALWEMAQAFRTGKMPTGNAFGSADQGGVDVTSVIRELELDENDVAVKAFRARSFSSETEAYREGAKLLKSITTKQPSAADLPSQVANGSGTPNKQDALMQEYNERAKGLRGQALINLKMEMRKKGLRSIS